MRRAVAPFEPRAAFRTLVADVTDVIASAAAAPAASAAPPPAARSLAGRPIILAVARPTITVSPGFLALQPRGLRAFAGLCSGPPLAARLVGALGGAIHGPVELARRRPLRPWRASLVSPRRLTSGRGVAAALNAEFLSEGIPVAGRRGRGGMSRRRSFPSRGRRGSWLGRRRLATGRGPEGIGKGIPGIVRGVCHGVLWEEG